MFDPYTNSTQWSRRFIGLKLFMALAEQGQSGYAEMLEHQARIGEVMRNALRASGWRIMNETPLPLVCFTREGLVPAEFLAAMHGARSHGCRRRGLVICRWCAPASPALRPPSRTFIGW